MFSIKPFVVLLLLCACQPEEYVTDSDVNLHFSDNTLDFDTLFSPLGSSTAYFTVHNPGSQNIIIRNIGLTKGANSPFQVNINGYSHWQVSDVRLAKRDSLYIFVEVRKGELFSLTDSIQFEINDNLQYVTLKAYSEEAVLIPDTFFSEPVTFSNLKPYLFTGNAIVSENVLARVEEGARLLFAKNKGMHVYGQLLVAGSSEKPVLFSHIRYRDAWYADHSAQWRGILFGGNGESKIVAAKFWGATQSIAVEDTLRASNHVQLTLSRCALFHAEQHLHVKGGRVIVDNTLFSNTSSHAVFLENADAQLYFCTLTSSTGRNVPLLQISNTDIQVVNSIIDGKNQNEIGIEQKEGALYKFDHCLLKLSEDFSTDDVNHFQYIVREAPLFQSPQNYDFRLQENSPAREQGKILYPDFPIDITGILRPQNLPPTIGAYE